MFVHNLDPTIFSIGPLAIRYYSLAYILGFLAAFFFMRWLIRKGHTDILNERQLDSLLIWVIIGVVAGGRLGYFILYQPMQLLREPLELLFIWHGGMAFHGGLVGLVIATYLFCRREQIPFLKLADILVIPGSLGLFLGRIANFINGELVGTPSSVPWCVVFPSVDELCRHPSQLYAAGKNFVLLAGTSLILWKTYAGRLRDGTAFWSFLVGYGILRFTVTIWRDVPTDPANFLLWGISWGQWMSLAVAAVGIVMLWRLYTNKQRNT